MLQELENLKKQLEDSLDAKTKKQIEDSVKAIEEKLAKVDTSTIEKDVKEIKETMVKKDELDKKRDEAIDKMVLESGKTKAPISKKSFGEAVAEQIAEVFETKQAEIKEFQRNRHAKLSIELKTVGNMAIANITGDGQATYNDRQGLVPNQKINFRDLIPTASSPTGLYVTYRETGTEGSISVQTEGNAKTQIDYDLTEVKVVSDYVAGYARFSKQMMFVLPWLQGTLPRMLLRDFYKKENDLFYTTTAVAATGSTTTGSTVDAEQLIDWVANQRQANFDSSFIIVDHTQWARLMKTKPSDYGVPGSFQIDPVGNVRIAGIQLIPASWAQTDHALIIDREYIERVETESLRVDFSYEDSDNFTKNLVTARVECFEDINLLRTDAHIYGDFGNS